MGKGLIIEPLFCFLPFHFMTLNSFRKEEKLKSKRAIDSLFSDGSSFKEYPFKVLYNRINSSACTNQVLISVPKRRFAKAVTRNRIKRLIRETYRLSKSDLKKNSELQGKYFALAFVYIGKDVPKLEPLNNAMKNALNKLSSNNQ